MRKVYVNLTVRLIIQAEEGIEISDIIDEMDYSFKADTEGAEIVDTEIQEHEITDSK